MGNLGGRIEEAKKALERADELCAKVGAPTELDRAPGQPELAEADASKQEDEAAQAEAAGESERVDAEAARARARLGQERSRDIESRRDRVTTLRRTSPTCWTPVRPSQAQCRAGHSRRPPSPSTWRHLLSAFAPVVRRGRSWTQRLAGWLRPSGLGRRMRRSST